MLMPRHRRNQLPTFVLYGDSGRLPPSLLHIESIAARSRLHDWAIGSHVHQGLHQLLWLRAGPVHARLDDAQVEAEGPLAVVIPPSVAHAFRFTPHSDGMVLTFDARRLAEGETEAFGHALQALFLAPRTLNLPPHEAARLQTLFAALQAEADASDDATVPAWLARCIVWRLADVARRDDGSPARRPGRDALYTRWVVLMEAHYRDHWPVARYAAQLGLSPERLNRLLRAETGQPAQTLLHGRLFREACRHLVHVAAPVSQIAFELGFDDPAYFCRFFKRHAGESPRAYRARAGS
jgi:AraC family transcriptional regulator, transcriptional activator of pobA